MKETAALLERRLDRGIRVEDALPAEPLDGLEKMPGRTDRRVDLEPVFHAGGEVVAAVPGSRVHGAGALFERHVVGEHAERVTGVERMAESDPLEIGPLHP